MSPNERPSSRSTPLIRELRSQDSKEIDDILAICQQSPEASNWSRDSYRKFAEDSGALILVAETNGAISGFLVARFAADQAEILNLAVTRAFRRQGHASTLLAAALKHLRSCTATSVYLEVRQSNTSAIAFYQSHGFTQSGIRKAYYQNPSEDALTMQKKLTATSG